MLQTNAVGKIKTQSCSESFFSKPVLFVR